MRFRHILLLISIFTVLLFTTCKMDEDEDLSVKTIKWELLDGYYQFYTNDAQYYEHTFWTTWVEPDTDFLTFTGTVKKMSGAEHYGYGFLFCYVDGNNFYRIMITKNGSYVVVKKYNGVYSNIIEWENSVNLNTGYNEENIIKVTRNPNTSVYTIYFNGKETDHFTDYSLQRNSIGIVASVGDETEEAFPNAPVDVRGKFDVSVLPSINRSVGNQTKTGFLNTGVYETLAD